MIYHRPKAVEGIQSVGAAAVLPGAVKKAVGEPRGRKSVIKFPYTLKGAKLLSIGGCPSEDLTL